jgi:hypothetical protein
MQNDSEEKRKNRIKGASAYMKYSGMAFQMAIIICAFAFGGQWVDKQIQHEYTFTVIGSLLGVGFALYLFIKQVLSD